jgi:hypothetical protein
VYRVTVLVFGLALVSGCASPAAMHDLPRHRGVVTRVREILTLHIRSQM